MAENTGGSQPGPTGTVTVNIDESKRPHRDDEDRPFWVDGTRGILHRVVDGCPREPVRNVGYVDRLTDATNQGIATCPICIGLNVPEDALDLEAPSPSDRADIKEGRDPAKRADGTPIPHDQHDA